MRYLLHEPLRLGPVYTCNADADSLSFGGRISDDERNRYREPVGLLGMGALFANVYDPLCVAGRQPQNHATDGFSREIRVRFVRGI